MKSSADWFIVAMVLLVIGILVMAIAGGAEGTSGAYVPYETTTTASERYKGDDDSTIGMTYTGKMGVNLGGGIIIPFDGSGPTIGFGF